MNSTVPVPAAIVLLPELLSEKFPAKVLMLL